MQAQTGEILVMASHPSFDANQLDTQGSILSHDPGAPLLNRATQGKYPPGTILEPFVMALLGDEQPSRDQWLDVYDALGFYRSPDIRIPVGSPGELNEQEIYISPLQLALAAASLSNNGSMPPARLALAVDTPNQGWVILPALDQPLELFSAHVAADTAEFYATNRVSYWQHISRSTRDESATSWIMTGTLPDWSGIPMVAVVALEEDNTSLAEYIARELFAATLPH
jgi:hypothetical protein